MADTKDSKLVSNVQKDPNFAVVCSFLTKYGSLLGLTDVTFEQLEKWIEETRFGECCVAFVMLRAGSIADVDISVPYRYPAL